MFASFACNARFSLVTACSWRCWCLCLLQIFSCKHSVDVALTRTTSSARYQDFMLSAVLFPVTRGPSASFVAIRSCSTGRKEVVRSPVSAWHLVRRVSPASSPLTVLANSFEHIMQTEGLSDSDRDEICADAVVWASQHGLVSG